MDVLAALPLGLAVGLVLGLVGGGGSVLMVPILVFVLGQEVHSATTTSLAAVAGAALMGGLVQSRNHHVCWRHAGAFAVSAIGGIIVGTHFNGRASHDALLLPFAGLMTVAALATWQRASHVDAIHDQLPEGIDCPPLRVGRDAVGGVIVGALTGFFGVGGGFIIVPVLAVALKFPLRAAIGTSLVIVSIVSLFGFIAHVAAGYEFDATLAVVLAVSCSIGAATGAMLGRSVRDVKLAKGFALLVACVAIYMAASVVISGGPAG